VLQPLGLANDRRGDVPPVEPNLAVTEETSPTTIFSSWEDYTLVGGEKIQLRFVQNENEAILSPCRTLEWGISKGGTMYLTSHPPSQWLLLCPPPDIDEAEMLDIPIDAPPCVQKTLHAIASGFVNDHTASPCTQADSRKWLLLHNEFDLVVALRHAGCYEYLNTPHI